MLQHSIDQTSCVTRLTISSSRITMAMLCRVYPEQGKQRRESIDVFRQTGSISRAWSKDDAYPHGVRRGGASFAKIAPPAVVIRAAADLNQNRTLTPRDTHPCLHRRRSPLPVR
jgi:hypothetical protein